MAKIVVADDDADIRELVVIKLGKEGHDVRAFGDGAAAVAACRDDKPDLVLLDVMMPGMTGVDATRVLRAEESTARTPIILLTARAQESDIDDGYSAGVDDYITKPFSPKQLAARVSTALEQGHA